MDVSKIILLVFCLSLVSGFGMVPPALGQNAGDIIFTEVMRNSAVVGDVSGEWFEIYNRTDSGINLQNWTLRDPTPDDLPDTPKVISTTELIIPARSYFLFAADADSNQNGGLPTVDVVFADRLDTYRLLNSADGLELRSPSNTVIDRVDWDDGTNFPDPANAGAAMQYILDVNDPNSHVLNNSGTNWTRAEIPYGGGDRGTPRQGLEEFDPVLDVNPDDLLDFGRTNMVNLPLPIQKDVDVENDGGRKDGKLVSVLSAEITSGDTANFSLVSPFTQIDLLPGKGKDIDINFSTGISENRIYSAVLTLTTNLPAPDDTVTVDLKAEVVLPVAAPAARAVLINEFSYDPQDQGVINDYNGDRIRVDAGEEEFVELFNTLDQAVDLSGWTLDDDSVENENTFVFPFGTTIPARGFLVVFGGGDPSNYPFQTFTGLPNLGNGGDQVYLNDGTDTDQDSVGYEDGATGTLNNIGLVADGGSLARQTDGGLPWESRTGPVPGPNKVTIGLTNDLSVPTPTRTPTGQVTPTWTPAPTATNTHSADFNGDEVVNAEDLLEFCRQWREERAQGTK